eukprot:CAMPEP_0204201714 /NCGR_PEP_ID=MMETSP0361-20130328/67674_1 /ASSEMBLY_ACC=CAM_ASM_000343 /TAXON_ID=268821 /ORGANISM="Scrippsiella Hangoei, Strain SHTV-5" /LENGTH=95 /DNA_ID=CAMNT_0051164387 /DNA_START=326 /DNA_END=608 /DNA_ORIENTATION=-
MSLEAPSQATTSEAAAAHRGLSIREVELDRLTAGGAQRPGSAFGVVKPATNHGYTKAFADQTSSDLEAESTAAARDQSMPGHAGCQCVRCAAHRA